MLPACAARKGPAFKPQFRICYLCGQQFGSASIAIHIPQCFAKKVSQWEIADPATRGKRPKHPDTVNWKGEGMSTAQQNEDQFHEFTANLVPCRNCGRKFLPDRLVVHLRSCKSVEGKEATRGGGGGVASSPPAPGRPPSRLLRQPSPAPRSPRHSSNGGTRSPGYKPQLPICYLCGQQFGSTSINIHVPQCYSKKLSQWEVSDVLTRGKPPKHPDTVNWKSGSTGIDEHNDAQFAEFVNNLEPCPNCGRKFLADRLVVHLRSCKPGCSSKPVSPPNTSATNATRFPEPARAAAAPAGSDSGSQPNNTHGGAGRRVVPDKTGERATSAFSKNDSTKLNPKTNRIPKDGSFDADGRTCPLCKAVEHDTSAKYCKDCGANLASKSLPSPCAKCGESIPEGSRFCGTCGVPINGAAASERDAGAENINAPTTRLVVCPGCKAICDADGNFCDNCGAALGDVEPLCATESTSIPTVKEVMYCQKCDVSFDDLLSKFCEECGEALKQMNINMVNGGGPSENPSTLPPHEVQLLSSSKVKTNSNHAPLTSGRKIPVESTGVDRTKKTPELPLNVSITSQIPGGGGGGGAVKGVPTSVAKESNTPRSNPTRPPALPPAPPSSNTANIPEHYDDTADLQERVPCAHCGRRFTTDVLARHEKVCTSMKKRKVYNSMGKRLSGTEAMLLAKSSPASATSAAPKKDWRAESEAFRRSMREARNVDKILKSGGNARDLPPPTYSENSHYTPCPHCNRKFAPDVAERHIPRCASTMNRPKPPPRRR